MERGFRDRDHLITTDRLVFTVVGNLHPPGRVISYLKYTPATTSWQTYSHRGFTRALPSYTMRDLMETLEFLKTRHPQYMFKDERLGVKFSGVPEHLILQHLRPEEHAQRLLNKLGDRLEEKAKRFLSRVSDASGVSLNHFGVTGSLLLNLHDERLSDLDFTVYGRRQSSASQQALKELTSENRDFKKFTGKEIVEFYSTIREKTVLSKEEYQKIYGRLWNRGRFEKTYFSLHPVKLEGEVEEKYGEKTYAPVGPVRLRGVVSNAEESIYLPIKYEVKDVEVLEGSRVNVSEVVSYDGLYAGVAVRGDLIEVRGTLERVLNLRNGGESYRAVIGSLAARGFDYLKLVS